MLTVKHSISGPMLFFCLLQYEIVLGRDRCLLSQGHNLYKLNYILLEEVKIENFQQKVTY